MKKESPPSHKLEIPIRRFITKRLIAVDKDATIQKTAARMYEFEISSIAILDDERVVGIVTDRDLKKRALGKARSPMDPIKDIMTSELITVDINSTIKDVLKLMSGQKIKHILVTENDEIVGITTLKDLQDLNLQELETLIARD